MVSVFFMGAGVRTLRAGGKDEGRLFDIVELPGAVVESFRNTDQRALRGGMVLAAEFDAHFTTQVMRESGIGAGFGDDLWRRGRHRFRTDRRVHRGQGRVSG